MIDISTIIVTYNSGNLVLDTLRSISEGVQELSVEVIVVDNASTDGTPARITQELPQVRIIVNDENRGFAVANNQGLATAVGRYLLLLNPDVIVHPGALVSMVDCLAHNPDVGIVGPRILSGNKLVALTAFPPFSVTTILWQYWGLGRLFPNCLSGQYRRDCHYAKVPVDVGWVTGACLMLRRDVYAKIGGLDEGFFLYAEEPDLCNRALEGGWRTYFCPSASVTHFESSTISRYTLPRVRHYHLSPLHYFSKRGRKDAVLALKIGFTMELLLKLLLRLFQIIWTADPELKSRIHAYWVVLRETWRYRPSSSDLRRK